MLENTVTRRRFVGAAAAAGWCLARPQARAQGDPSQVSTLAEASAPHAPIGVAGGVHPGRVAWSHEPKATSWEGPGRGHWWENSHTDPATVDRMMSRSVCELAGEPSEAAAWDRLFRHLNRIRGKGDIGYRPGEKIAIKVNFVGFIWRWNAVDPADYDLKGSRDYMNTSPQMIRALLRQLVRTVRVKQADIVLGDTLAYFPNEYHKMLHDEFPEVQYVDHKGQFGRVATKSSSVPLYWSSHPEGCRQDHVPECFVGADYLVNMANLKSHTGSGVTLCAKNHYGSLVRWPAEKGYFDLHESAFATGTSKYRNLVDLMGHQHLGGKTLLYLIDGLYAGRHPIDSVALDFLRAEWDDYPHKSGAEDYLHEAAQANDPPSATFYDPNHSGDLTRLASLGVHEHWNNRKEKKYSRNLGTGKGVELVAVDCA